MKMTSRILGLSLLALLLGAFGCSKRPDSAALKGTWQGREGGAARTDSLVLSDNNLEFHGANPQEWYKGTFTLHEDSDPKQMIITITDCPFPKYVGQTANAIYRIEKGKLTIAGNEPGDPAMPTAFNAPGTRTMVFTMK
jgi:uncharacterized protein (TIGR03067 family)